MASLNNLTSSLMEAVVGIILVAAVAIPIIGGMTIPETIENDDIIKTLIGIVPVLLTVAVILGVVYATVLKKKN